MCRVYQPELPWSSGHFDRPEGPIPMHTLELINRLEHDIARYKKKIKFMTVAVLSLWILTIILLVCRSL